jgi:hypothetical protein
MGVCHLELNESPVWHVNSNKDVLTGRCCGDLVAILTESPKFSSTKGFFKKLPPRTAQSRYHTQNQEFKKYEF